ncbi:hypothetical protein AGMMS50276_20220 [Synergistales bacterium]|nr:hypothetical protein AGMMS50276_20220 [Synergistales bacterium]
MKFVVLNQGQKLSTLAHFFEKPNYEGDAQDLTTGRFSAEQIRIRTVGSVKLEPNVTLIAYEGPSKSTGFKIINVDVPDLSVALSFKPIAYSLGHNVAAFKDGKQAGALVPGVYAASALKQFDRLHVPDEVKVSFWRGETTEPEESKVKSFAQGDLDLDKVGEYDRFAVILMANKEVVAQANEPITLSDEELAAVAGGDKANACGAQACGADLCGAQACGAQACGVNVVPLMPIGP